MEMKLENAEQPQEETQQDQSEESSSPILGREAILQADDTGYYPLDVPEWGGTVLIRVITAGERDAFESSLIRSGKKNKPNLKDVRAKFAALIICDEQGTRLFNKADIDSLTRKSGAALDRIYDYGREINRFSEEDEKELTENFTEDHNADSYLD